MNDGLDPFRAKRAFVCDMDGVIYHGNRLLPGAEAFVAWLHREAKEFLFLTNSSERTPRELREKLKRLGIDVEERHFYTSALATAAFLASTSCFTLKSTRIKKASHFSCPRNGRQFN